jgi:hypothetical protein
MKTKKKPRRHVFPAHIHTPISESKPLSWGLGKSIDEDPGVVVRRVVVKRHHNVHRTFREGRYSAKRPSSHRTNAFSGEGISSRDV